MSKNIDKILQRFEEQHPKCLSIPGKPGYVAATRIWAMPVGRTPRAVIHCRTPDVVPAAIRVARDCDLPLSIRGGGYDWAGRALCDGIVIDLSGMRDVDVNSAERIAHIAGGARAADVLAATDPLGLAVAAGSVGTVGMAGTHPGRRLWSPDRPLRPDARQPALRGGGSCRWARRRRRPRS
jgi:hypothetical protein